MIDSWLLDQLRCPVDHTRLGREGTELVSGTGNRYPVIDGIPVLLVPSAPQTIGLTEASLARAWDRLDEGSVRDEYFVDTLGISAEEKQRLTKLIESGAARIDPVACFLVGATCGIAYVDAIGRMQDYPIPRLRMPAAAGEQLLDIGCSWGRWSIAAARAGYRVIGMDPSLGAVMAARRIARELNLDVEFIVGDGRYLPFADCSFDAVFSYSVLQHFSREDLLAVLSEVGRALRPGGKSKIQMASKSGLRSLYHQIRRGFRQTHGFDVRYWGLHEMKEWFEMRVGPTDISADCYFGLGLQPSDVHFMSVAGRWATRVSEILRRLSGHVTAMVWAADSVYLTSARRPT